MIDVIKLVLDGGMVEFHGAFYDFDKLQMSPAPSKPVPFYVGGHTDVALRRAVRIGDGWTSAMMKGKQIAETIAQLKRCWPTQTGPTTRSNTRWCASTSSASTGTASSPNPVSPTTSSSRGCSTAWASTPPLEQKKDAMKRFADTYIHSGWQE